MDHVVRRRTRVILLVALATGLVLSTVAAGTGFAGDWSTKVASRVMTETADGHSTSFLVVMAARANVSRADAIRSKAAKGQYVLSTLSRFANRTQAGVRALLNRQGVAYKAHWAVNAITILRGDRSLVQALASRADVGWIDVNDWVRSPLLPKVKPILTPKSTAPNGIEWNVSKIKAPNVWAQGDKGEGIVIGDIDTGFQWDHPALKSHYRGWNGSTANHNYNWYDETDPSNRAPLDPFGHGTHTVGTIAGDDGGSNQIGVAPGSKWIGCRSMNASGLGTPDTYIGCIEFMMAPWDLNGQNPDPSKAPAAISDSWYCSISQGECPDNTVLLTAVQSIRAAGIVPVFAAGNSGPGCQTIGNDGPPAQYDEAFTVGATTMSNTLASFSSRGPVNFQGMRIKPDIVAPGQTVRSSYPPNTYATLDGTSMATPHIAGTIALILNHNPQLMGDVDGIESAIEHTAQHVKTTTCSSNGSFPNNLYGWGLVNAAKATRNG